MQPQEEHVTVTASFTQLDVDRIDSIMVNTGLTTPSEAVQLAISTATLVIRQIELGRDLYIEEDGKTSRLLIVGFNDTWRRRARLKTKAWLSRVTCFLSTRHKKRAYHMVDRGRSCRGGNPVQVFDRTWECPTCGQTGIDGTWTQRLEQ
ncbi:hypothetical protein KC906_00635 [Candidatus Kaiserbacteria bacterium]|nr:hypothetical protein [Candidatus Kaiserbacteria bacterium]MCB9812129.1 hypothetical protein [Candidatus Nomurabacteria bacterium]